nr:SIT4 phosphatase-associated family protein [Tanacetum cinerariifolium]
MNFIFTDVRLWIMQFLEDMVKSSTQGLWSSGNVESILDKENFTLEELLDEEDIIQECKALNSRLINFLRVVSSHLQPETKLSFK